MINFEEDFKEGFKDASMESADKHEGLIDGYVEDADPENYFESTRSRKEINKHADAILSCHDSLSDLVHATVEQLVHCMTYGVAISNVIQDELKDHEYYDDLLEKDSFGMLEDFTTKEEFRFLGSLMVVVSGSVIHQLRGLDAKFNKDYPDIIKMLLELSKEGKETNGDKAKNAVLVKSLEKMLFNYSALKDVHSTINTKHENAKEKLESLGIDPDDLNL